MNRMVDCPVCSRKTAYIRKSSNEIICYNPDCKHRGPVPKPYVSDVPYLSEENDVKGGKQEKMPKIVNKARSKYDDDEEDLEEEGDDEELLSDEREEEEQEEEETPRVETRGRPKLSNKTPVMSEKKSSKAEAMRYRPFVQQQREGVMDTSNDKIVAESWSEGIAAVLNMLEDIKENTTVV